MVLERSKWLALWGYEDGTPEADGAWNAKLELDARVDYGSKMTIIPDIGGFKSPVDNSFVSSRTALREHNKRNGVEQLGNDRITRTESAPMRRAGYDVKRALDAAAGR